MGSDILLLFFFALISIVFSFLCSVWEAVLLSITPAYAQVKKQESGFVGKKLDEFKQNIDQPLSAILTLNTVAHTVGAMGVGAMAAQIWSDSAWKIPYLGIGMEAVVGVVMTLAILYLSEIIPKTIGANNWKRLTPFTVRSLNFIIKLLYPLVWVSQLITKYLKKDKNKSIFSRADFTAMAEIATKGGELQENESKIIKNLLRFDSILAKDVMTPRTVVKAASEDTTIEAFHNENPTLRFSRIPIFSGNKDNINGFVMKNEILSAMINGKGSDTLKSIRRDIMIVNEQFPIPDLFSKFMEDRKHIALVVDEFGGMSGIVTMEDVIETLIGMEIMDELDNTPNMQLLARKNWEKRAKNLGLIEDDIEE